MLMAEKGPLALSLSDVSKAFGGLRAVDGVSLQVNPGERRAIIGPNGAGKTTLFSLISGELALTDGRITLFGRDVTRLPPHPPRGPGHPPPGGPAPAPPQAPPPPRPQPLPGPLRARARAAGGRRVDRQGGGNGPEPLPRRAAPARDRAGPGGGPRAPAAGG